MHKPVVRRVLAAVIALAVSGAVTTGCSAPPPAPPADAVVVALDMTGGMCRDGACAQHTELRADGTVVGPDGSRRSLNPIEVERARLAIDAADFTAILARPFTGQCPVAYDGAEWTWTFHAAHGEVAVASCTTQIDPGQEPFSTLTELMVPAGG